MYNVCNVILLYHWFTTRCSIDTSFEKHICWNETAIHCFFCTEDALKVYQAPLEWSAGDMYNVCNCCTAVVAAGYLDVFKVAESNISEVFSLGG